MKIGCHIIAGDPSLNLDLQLYQKAYDHWRQTWDKEIFQNIPFISDYFLMLQNIFVLTHKDNIAGMAAFNFYDLSIKAHRETRYMQIFEKCGFIKKCAPNDILISVEFVSRNPLYSVKNTSLSLGSILIGLIQEEFKLSNASYALGTPSIHQNVTELASEYGYYKIGELEKYGVPCAIVVNSRQTVQKNLDPKYSNLVDHLFQNRIISHKTYREKKYEYTKAI